MLEFSGFVQLGDTSRYLKLHKQLSNKYSHTPEIQYPPRDYTR